jgi:acylglycerol lipase
MRSVRTIDHSLNVSPAVVYNVRLERKASMTQVVTSTAREETVTGTGGLNIFVRSWRPNGAARAIVVICHGFNAHSGQYQWVGEQFVALGLAVYAVDLRGRGRSDGERFYVDQMADYVSDVAAVVSLARKRHAGLPVYLLGHSAGGVVSCLYTLEHQSELAGLICESFAFQVPTPDFAIAVLRGVSHLAPHAHVVKLENEDFSRDPEVVRAMNDDPLIADEVQPTRTVAELAMADERLKREFPLITLPLLILHGTLDKVTRPSGSQLFYDTAGAADKTLKLYEGHYHDLLHDLDKERVFADITGWIEARVPAAPTVGTMRSDPLPPPGGRADTESL